MSKKAISPDTNGGQQTPVMTENKRVTSLDEIEQNLKVLQANKDKWAAIGIGERIKILDEITRAWIPISEPWIQLSIVAKGVTAGTVGEAEEWAMLAMVFNLLNSLRQSLSDIKKYGLPRVAVKLASNGQAVATVFPRTRTEALMFPGLTEEVWMEPGVSVEETLRSQARKYGGEETYGAVNVALGAGNVSALPAFDVLHKLFVDNRVVILKLNPVNEYLGPLMEKGFHALIDRGFLRIVYGGSPEGTYLRNHPLADEISVTGSDKTFEAIVFGTGEQGAENKAQRRPLVSKPITGELGNVTPVIIVPGPWSEADIAAQAEKLTKWLASNAGCNCLTPRVIVQHKNWNQRAALVKAIGGVMANLDTRKAYYPGAKERFTAFVSAHPNAQQFGDSNQGHLPWTLIPDVDPKSTNDLCFTTEAFCSLFAETAIDAASVPEYIDRAVDFVNGTLWGTLTATIIIHPKSLLDPAVAKSLDRALVNLHYGTICINESASVAAFFARTPWGGFPGHDIYDIQSGIGWTTNTLMFDRPQKTIIRSQYRKKHDPALFNSKHPVDLYKKLTYYLASPSMVRMLSLVWTQLRS